MGLSVELFLSDDIDGIPFAKPKYYLKLIPLSYYMLIPDFINAPNAPKALDIPPCILYIPFSLSLCLSVSLSKTHDI